MKFSTFAEKLIKKQMEYDAPPSGIYTYKKTQGLLNRQKGLLEFFGNRDIRKISKQDIESFMSQLSLDGKTLTRGTIYKHINILKQILELADIEVSFPKIRGAKKAGQRGWFNLQNYKTILDKSNELVGKKFEIAKYKNIQITEDFHDFIIFMVGSMLRPTLSEVYSLKFKDINVKELDGVKYLEFTMQRKNQMMAVQTLPTSYYAYRDICKRRPDHSPEDYLFMPEYENRRTATGHMSKLFGLFLKEIGLQHDEDGNKLSTYSLRHTAITFNLSQKGVDSWDIMRRADTSKDMIEKYYYPRSQRDEKLKDFLRF
jgi:integrase